LFNIFYIMKGNEFAGLGLEEIAEKIESMEIRGQLRSLELQHML